MHSVARDLTAATSKNDNDSPGVLVSLAATPPEAQYAVYELSMLGPNSVRRKSERVRPHVALITRIGQAHLEYHESVEALADAKAKVFAGLEPGGVAVLNRDDPFFDRLKAHADQRASEVVTFGAHLRADVRLVGSRRAADGGSYVEAQIGPVTVAYELGATGSHHVSNSLGVLAAVKALGADPEAAAQTFAELRDAPGRGNRYCVPLAEGEVTVLDFTRSAEPLSVRAALVSLGEQHPAPSARRIAVLGDMHMLGDASTVLHTELARDVVGAEVDLVFAAGEEMRHLYEALPPTSRVAHAQTADDLAATVVEEVKPGDILLIQGARRMRMNRVVKAIVGPDRYHPW
ncbi:MAG TPA: Mur ligase family protein [Solirubrobacterales bacterium]|nr:Mur ligase family protein [Solirubrobacterales bacterium]